MKEAEEMGGFFGRLPSASEGAETFGSTTFPIPEAFHVVGIRPVARALPFQPCSTLLPHVLLFEGKSLPGPVAT